MHRENTRGLCVDSLKIQASPGKDTDLQRNEVSNVLVVD